MTDRNSEEPSRKVQGTGRVRIETTIRQADGTIREHLIEDEEVI